MSEYVPPCGDKANNPDDWFIGRDGKQYSDDVLLTLDEVEVEIARREAAGETDPERLSFADVGVEMHDARVAAQLRRRRHAKDKCYVECKMRLECLIRSIDFGGVDVGEDALTPPAVLIEYGTFGGYYEEERRQIVTTALARRQRSSA